MTLKIAELHHLAVRITSGPDAVGAALRFYSDVLGFESDHVPWDRPGENQRINAGAHAQIHLVPGTPKAALGNGEMNESENADRGQQQGHSGERRHQPRLKSTLCRKIAKYFVNGLHLQHDRTRVYRFDRVANGCSERSRIRIHPDHHVHGGFSARKEELRHRTRFEPVTTHVADNPNDCDPGVLRLGASFLEALADRLLPSEKPPRKGFVDDSNPGVLLLMGEESPADEGNAHGAENLISRPRHARMAHITDDGA